MDKTKETKINNDFNNNDNKNKPTNDESYDDLIESNENEQDESQQENQSNDVSYIKDEDQSTPKKNTDLTAQTPNSTPTTATFASFATSQDRIFKIFLVILVVFVAMVFKGVYSSRNTESFQTKRQNEIEVDFKYQIEKLMSKYPNQTTKFWANIISCYEHTLVRSKDPAIVLIVGDQRTKHSATSIANEILDTIKKLTGSTSTLNGLTVDPNGDPNLNKLIQSDEITKAKLYVDDKLKGIFSNGERVALVNNIQVLPAESMLLFYSYGDEMNTAKYPGVVILMTLELNMELSDIQRSSFLESSAKQSRFVENYLLELWSPYIGQDQLKPLFTRIANNVMLVNIENIAI